jgi:hypothetical protein
MDGVRGAVRDIVIRKHMINDRGRVTWFKLGADEGAIVRFLEHGDDVNWAWCHDLPVEGKKWGRAVPCRDQGESGRRIDESCPGCEQAFPRKFKGFINVIWRDAPVFAKDADGLIRWGPGGKPIVEGEADQLAVWNTGPTVFEDLARKDVAWGLTSRDFLVTRRGAGLQTKYVIEPSGPHGDPVPMSESDKELAATKTDLTRYVTPQSYANWGRVHVSENENAASDVPAGVGPFLERSA